MGLVQYSHNKVVVGSRVYIDLTGDSVTAERMFEGDTAHDKTGKQITGTAKDTRLRAKVYVDSGSTVTATKGSQSVSGVSENGSVTLLLPESGAWTFTATKDGESSVPKTENMKTDYEVDIKFISLELNENTWEQIRAISDEGTAANYWSVGDTKEITLNGTIGTLTLSNYSVYAYIIGIDHNAALEGANRIHFMLGKTAQEGGTDIAFCDRDGESDGTFHINVEQTNTGGWGESYMRKTICGTSMEDYSGTILSAIPEELRASLKNVTKYTDNTGNSNDASAITATTDYFFLLSEYEVFGTITQGNANEADKQRQYPYYAAGNSKKRYNYGELDTAVRWWLRSPYSSNYRRFVLIEPNGNVASVGADFSYGFAPAFCV